MHVYKVKTSDDETTFVLADRLSEVLGAIEDLDETEDVPLTVALCEPTERITLCQDFEPHPGDGPFDETPQRDDDGLWRISATAGDWGEWADLQGKHRAESICSSRWEL